MDKYIIALDQGTTSCRAIVFNEKLTPIATAQKEFTQFYPQPGWVEHDANEIYATQMGVLQEVLVTSGIDPHQIAGIGITNQRETTVVWDKNTGKPIHNAIVWQCRRTADICEGLKADGLDEYILQNTGLVVDAYFSGTKIAWLLDHVEGAREAAERGDLLFGTMDSFLVWKMSKGAIHITDYTNASRTMIYNIRELCWDKKLCTALNIPMQMLPTVKSCSEIYGYTNIEGVRVPIAGIAGDQQAALFGQGCFTSGEAKNTYGTGCFLLMNTGENLHISQNGLVTTIASGIDGKINYALEGSIFVGGAVIQWLRDQMGLISSAAESEAVAMEVPDNGGVYIVPAFTGLGAPHWDMYARGTITGLTRGSSKEHIVRAALESIAYQSYDVLKAMENDTGLSLRMLKVDGGASDNNLLMQFQADVLQGTVMRSANKETTALGAAALAGLAVGVFKNQDEIKALLGNGAIFSPTLPVEVRDTYLKEWSVAITQTTTHSR